MIRFYINDIHYEYPQSLKNNQQKFKNDKL
jgi:hypothetical protein